MSIEAIKFLVFGLPLLALTVFMAVVILKELREERRTDEILSSDPFKSTKSQPPLPPNGAIFEWDDRPQTRYIKARVYGVWSAGNNVNVQLEDVDNGTLITKDPWELHNQATRIN